MNQHPEQHSQHEHHDSEAHHPGPRTYVKIGIILAILTALEVIAFDFMTGFDSATVVWIIMILSLAKFGYVIAYFMHLKFDDWRYTALFMSPFVIMLSITVALLAMFQNLTR